MSEFHCCLPDGRGHLSGGWAYRERWRFKRRDTGGKSRQAPRHVEKRRELWHKMERGGAGAVRFMFDIGLTLMLDWC